MTRSLLADAFGHHVWATQRLIDTCRRLTPEQLQTAVPGTYGSIIEKLRHLIGGDRSYLFVLTGGVLPEIGEDEEAALDLAAVRAIIDADGPAWEAFLADERGLDPDAVVVRHRDDGSESHAPRGIRLAQVIHHGTDHRSQICTALTSLGVEPPEIDAWDFARSQGRLSETPPTA